MDFNLKKMYRERKSRSDYQPESGLQLEWRESDGMEAVIGCSTRVI